MRAFGYALLIILLSSCGGNAEVAIEGPWVSLEVGQVPLEQAVAALPKPAGRSIVIDPLAKGQTVGPVSIKDASFDNALRAIVNSGSLQLTISGGTYCVTTRLGRGLASDLSKQFRDQMAAILEDSPTLAFILPRVEFPQRPGTSRKPEGTPCNTIADPPKQPGISGTQQKLIGMSRYELSNALGRPDRVVYSRVPGCESWYYGGTVVELVSSRVACTRTEEHLTSVSIGPTRKKQFPSLPTVLHAPSMPPAVSHYTISTDRMRYEIQRHQYIQSHKLQHP